MNNKSCFFTNYIIENLKLNFTCGCVPADRYHVNLNKQCPHQTRSKTDLRSVSGATQQDILPVSVMVSADISAVDNN